MTTTISENVLITALNNFNVSQPLIQNFLNILTVCSTDENQNKYYNIFDRDFQTGLLVLLGSYNYNRVQPFFNNNRQSRVCFAPIRPPLSAAPDIHPGHITIMDGDTFIKMYKSCPKFFGNL